MLQARKRVYIGRAIVEFSFKNYVGTKAQLGEVWGGVKYFIISQK